MVYLNAVERGGETLFRRLGHSRVGEPMGPNPFTLHEALPVQAGHKWVITKWFRSKFGLNG